MSEGVQGSPWARRLLLAALLALAAGLRFDALDWGLRHPPHPDERVFVRNAGLMLAAHDLDHRYYEYPGLFVYLLAAVLARIEPRDGAQAYLVGRALVATFGVLSVALTYRVGKRQAGTTCGLAAAALLAVSPVEIRTAHMLRPDVVLESFVLMALLAQGGLGSTWRRTAGAGAAMGAATAVKFTGALLAPSLALRLVAVSGRPWRALFVAGVAASLAFVALSPYTLLGRDRALSGAGLQLGYFYVRRAATDMGGLMVQAHYFRDGLGTLGAGLALCGGILALRAWREWIHLLALPAAFAIAFSTTNFHAERYILPSLGATAVVAALAVDALRRRWPVAALLVALLSLAQPLAASLAYLNALHQPRTQDVVADWLALHLPPGSRLLIPAEVRLGLPAQLEQVVVRPSDVTDPGVALEFDAMVLPSAAGVWAKLAGREVFRAVPATPHSGVELQVLAPARKRGRLLDLASTTITVPQAGAALTVLGDGDLATRLRFTRPGSMEIGFGRPVRLTRAELVTPDRAQAQAEVQLLVSRPDAAGFSAAGFLEARPGLEEQWGLASRVLLLDGSPVERLRIAIRPRRGAFSVAELHLELEAAEPPL